MGELWWIGGLVIAALAAAGYAYGPRRHQSRRTRLILAQHGFHLEREWLEVRFVQLAGERYRHDLPRWVDCDFADEVAYVRSRSTGELSALVAVTLAAEPCDMAAVSNADAVGNLQAGTAVFRFDGKHWVTDGRAILNLSPTEAIAHFQDDLEMVSEDPRLRPYSF